IEAMRDNPSLTLQDGDVVEFQDSLLRAIGYPLSISALTENLDSLAQASIQFSGENGLLANRVPAARRAFAIGRNLRRELNGACPLMALIHLRPVEIKDFLLATTLIEIGATQISRDSFNDEVEMMSYFDDFRGRHASRIADELLYGSQGCSAAEHCKLPHRRACDELTFQLTPYVQQCPREDLIARLADSYDLDRFLIRRED
ncbi:hypothetical protein, partial [Frankia sp. AgW1.1]